MVAVACPAVEVAALAVGGAAFLKNVALPKTVKLREALETCQEAQQALVAVAAVPVLAIAREAFYLEETLLASLPPVVCGCGAGVCAYGPTPILVGGGGDDYAGHDHEPFGGVRGSWAAHDLHLQIATGLLVAAALQKLIQLMHVAVDLLEPDAFWLYQDWPDLCLLARKRTGKRMMTWQTNHSTR